MSVIISSKSDHELDVNSDSESESEGETFNNTIDFILSDFYEIKLFNFSEKQKKMYGKIAYRFYCNDMFDCADINEFNIDKIYDLLIDNIILEEDDMIYNYYAGVHYYFKDNIKNAIKYLKKSSQYNYAFAYLLLGSCYGDLNKSEKVITNYLIAIEKGIVMAYDCLGRHYLSINEPDNAKNYFAIGAEKGDMQCSSELCLLYKDEGNIEYYQKYNSMYELNKSTYLDKECEKRRKYREYKQLLENYYFYIKQINNND